MILIKLLVGLVFPLLFTGLIHHFIIIRYNLFAFLTVPVDLNLTFRNRPLIGKSKTWRGLIAVTVLNGLITYFIWQAFGLEMGSGLPAFAVGTLMGSGYVLAELLTSFIKRRLGLPPSGQAEGIPGVVLYILDQSDSVFGSLLAANLVISEITFNQNLLIAGTGIGLHAFFDWLLYMRGYKRKLAKPVIFRKRVSPETPK